MPETTRLSGIPRQRISIDATAAQFAEWAYTTHLAECRTCRTELCPAGMRYQAAAAGSNDDLPGIPTL